MKGKLKKLYEKCKQVHLLKKVISIIALIVAVSTIIYLALFAYSVYRTNQYAVIAIGILLAYLYPFFYEFVKEIRTKDKKIATIIETGSRDGVKEKLENFDFYTLPQFVANLLKQFSSLWIFVFLQVIFQQIPEFYDPKSEATMEVYVTFIIMALMICVSFYLVIGGNSLAISTESFGKKRHVEYIMKVKKIS